MQQEVLHLARRSAPDIGGVESHLSHLLPELRRLGYDSSILNEKMLLSTSSWIPAYKLKIWFGIAQKLPKLWRSDIIHIHDVFWWLLPFLPVLWWKKIFITFHGYESVTGPSRQQKFWHQLAALLTRGKICIGGFHEKWYGVVGDKLSYGAVTPLGTKLKKHSKKSAIFIGRLESDTGFRSYLKAIRLAKQAGVVVSLDVYGEGDERAWAETYCQKHKLPVRFFRFVPEARMHLSKYSHAFASQYLAILESLSAGVSVISYAGTAFKRDYLQMTPFSKWIQIATLPAEIVLALTKSVQPSLAARTWAQKQTWKKLAKQYHELWST